jgi:glycosyltransferase involved in cell wall biosynthesis
LEPWQNADGHACREAVGIPSDAFVVGHVGRLAPEKNLQFLAQSVAAFLGACQRAHFLVVGHGESEADIRRIIGAAGLAERLHCVGPLDLPALANAYGAMDVFAFASKSETQGMVLTEAMAAGVPVVALDAPGVREVVRENENGRLLAAEDRDGVTAALASIEQASIGERRHLIAGARATAAEFSIGRTAETALAIYGRLRGDRSNDDGAHYDSWMAALRLIEAEWNVLAGLAEATGAALRLSSRETGAPS